jgi:hypothetical protein
LLRTCRLIHEEALPVFHERITYVFTPEDHDIWRTGGDGFLDYGELIATHQRIKKATIKFGYKHKFPQTRHARLLPTL